MWEFAAVMQYIATFGDVVKIDKEFDINDFEDECMKPEPSDKLEDIGLCLLKWISSHRGLTLDIWDEYTRRQYMSKAPHKNPYGDEETPKRFREFDTFTKIRVLHQLTIWTLWNPDRMRDRMPEQTELQQTDWRIEEFGWDRDDRTYYLLDDNRLYRRTDPLIHTDSAWKPKKNTLKAQAARRRERKRRRTRADGSPEATDGEEESKLEGDTTTDDIEGKSENSLSEHKWECVCVTLQQYKDFVDAHRKSRDPNEKALISRLETDLMPILEKAEEAQLRKIQKRERELLAMEKLATAKRSSRLAGKHERERIEQEQAEADKKRQADLAAARKMEEQQRRMEEERQSRMLTREQRIREREYKRVLQEEELLRLEEEAKRIEAGELRGNRHLKATMEQTKKELEELQNDDEWMFDCAGCGLYGKNFDDGEHSIQCEKCNTWQHSKCYNVSQTEAESDDFHFVCKDCRRKEEEAKKPKIPPLKFRVGASSSPPADAATIEVAKKPRGRPKKAAPSTESSFDQRSPNAAPASSHAAPGSTANGFSSPQQFPPPASYGAPSPSPAKTSPYMNGVFQASPQRPQSQMTNSLGQGYYGQMSPPPQLSHFGQSPHRPTPSFDLNMASQSNSSPCQPRPTSSQSNQAILGTPAAAGSIPSPLHNRPAMSPTQGNPEVGPLAGVPTPKPIGSSMSPPALPATPQAQTNQGTNGIVRPTLHPQMPDQSPSIQPQLSTPLMNHMSGRSPTKHSPPPSFDQTPQPIKSQPPGTFHQSSTRSVSGTPIYPPSSTLAPSPKQLDTTPVPTPSKHMTPLKHNEGQKLVPVPGETIEMIREKAHQADGQQQQSIGVTPPQMEPTEIQSTTAPAPAPTPVPHDVNGGVE